jgi:hypothetical protein
MVAVRTAETSADNLLTRQYNPEDSSEHHTRRRENLKSQDISLIRTRQVPDIPGKVYSTVVKKLPNFVWNPNVHYCEIQVLMEATTNIISLWDTGLCSLVEVDQRFRVAYCLHHGPVYGGSTHLWNVGLFKKRLHGPVSKKAVIRKLPRSREPSTSLLSGVRWIQSTTSQHISLTN